MDLFVEQCFSEGPSMACTSTDDKNCNTEEVTTDFSLGQLLLRWKIHCYALVLMSAKLRICQTIL